MSWFADHYEKAALGGAVVVTLSLASFGFMKYKGVSADFANELKGPKHGRHDASVAGAESVPKALQSLKLQRLWEQAIDGNRPVDLFTGVALFVSKLAPQQCIDLVKDGAVHNPIPNQWWLEHNLDPGFVDSPKQDPDQDGFSNLEEYLAKTNPNDRTSHPSLLSKLIYVKDKSLIWELRPGYGVGESIPFTYWEVQDSTWKLVNKMPPAEMVNLNQVFFPAGAMANRFKFVGLKKIKEHNQRTHSDNELLMVVIEDQKPNKKGELYEFPSPLPEHKKNELAQYDRTAVLILNAIGQSATEFEVEERTHFAIPANAPQKKYYLKRVTPNSIVVEFKDPSGVLETVEIPKSGAQR